ncbi:MAG TPA: beta-lactamase family protein [Chloroflexi bacterium]|jgi:CubicO group peptidase (beta-lactamase class C family)|nr:beta-lactamase family protein [Chloroflexota bacterium]
MEIVRWPEEIGLSTERLERVYDRLDDAVRSGHIPAAAIMVGRYGRCVAPRYFGRSRLAADGPPVDEDTLFLVASVTKPVVVTAAMRLVEGGLLALDDAVTEYVPEFAVRGKEETRIRHLMTHTSGLPDMLPENVELRRAHAPLSEFIERTCRLEPDFPPGSDIRYQSMGIAVLGEVVARISGMALPDFLHREIFRPLGMINTWLGCPSKQMERIAHVNVEEEMRGTDWGWNSPYWWGLGAPWGGMISTVTDLSRFLLAHARSGAPLLSRATVEAMARDQTSTMAGLPPEVRVGQSWGLGWRRVAGTQWSTYFGDLLSPGSYGHGGATGTVVWIDPQRELTCALFTTEPAVSSARLLGRCSNMVAASAL